MSAAKTLQFPSTQTTVSTAASVVASTMLFRLLAREYLPCDLQHYIYFKLKKLFASFSSEFVLVVDEYEGLGNNHLFQALELYLRPQIHPNTRIFRVTMPKKENKISVVMQKNQEIIENFNGVELRWKLVSTNIPSKYINAPRSEYYPSTLKSELRYYELRFNMKHRDMVLSEYLPYVMEQAKDLKEERKTLKLFTMKRERVRYSGRRPEMWQSVNLDHPATFDTLAMDLNAKQGIMEDLDRFVQRKDFYRKVGKAWKRGYLLFGPPGTGKSSLIGAMANYLNFDVYDLELSGVRRNSELRNLLISTGNRSILVVEDIDCSIDLQDRRKNVKMPTVSRYPHEDQELKVTLSAVLNFIDGLWSSCGDERIIVFTTNHKDKLDPALLRPGRMDVHIHMSYCSPSGFRILASNYLGITEHPLFVEVERLLKITNVTPAEVGEELLKNEDSELALKSLLHFLTHKSAQTHETDSVTHANMI